MMFRQSPRSSVMPWFSNCIRADSLPTIGLLLIDSTSTTDDARELVARQKSPLTLYALYFLLYYNKGCALMRHFQPQVRRFIILDCRMTNYELLRWLVKTPSVTLSIIICSPLHGHLGWHYNVSPGWRHVTFTKCKRKIYSTLFLFTFFGVLL